MNIPKLSAVWLVCNRITALKHLELLLSCSFARSCTQTPLPRFFTAQWTSRSRGRVSGCCRIVYKRNNYITHIRGDLSHNCRQTEAGGLGLHTDGIMCLQTYTVYICIMISSYIWHWKANCRVRMGWGCALVYCPGNISRKNAKDNHPDVPVKRLFIWRKNV